MKIGGLILICLTFSIAKVQSQELFHFSNPSQTIQLRGADLVSLDTRDQIFVSNSTGDIYLFDSKGKQLNLFSPPRQAKLTQLEAAWTVNIFSFSTDLQEYRILDRFLNPLTENSLSTDKIILPKAATLGNNNVIWIWDESDLNLKSLNFLQNQILQSQPLNLILETENLQITEIREFKNRVFINAPESGIFIFDNQGNFLKQVNLKIDQPLCFYREHLFWIEGTTVKSYSLESEEVDLVGLIESEDILALQIGQEILTLLKKDEIEIYPIPENLKSLK